MELIFQDKTDDLQFKIKVLQKQLKKELFTRYLTDINSFLLENGFDATEEKDGIPSCYTYKINKLFLQIITFDYLNEKMFFQLKIGECECIIFVLNFLEHECFEESYSMYSELVKENYERQNFGMRRKNK